MLQYLYYERKCKAAAMKLFTKDRDFYRSLIALSVPIALQNLVTSTT